MQGKASAEQNRVARTSCLYALMLAFFFLLFGTLCCGSFGVSLSMIRGVGGIILTRIGFQMFNPPPQAKSGLGSRDGLDSTDQDAAFIPLSMPIMFGPGAIATILGMGLIFHGVIEFLQTYGIVGGRVVSLLAHSPPGCENIR